MMSIKAKIFMIISIVLLYLTAFVFCPSDTINLNKRGCLFMNQLGQDEEIISFEYKEGYYRAIHANYEQRVYAAVKMRYLGDSTKDLSMTCIISPKNAKIISDLYHYRIPCHLNLIQRTNLTEGTYCIEIVKNLIGDISSGDYCTDFYSFQSIRSFNIPSLNVTGFSEDQEGCVLTGEKISLIAIVKNKVSVSQDYEYLGIGLSNIEKANTNISL